MISEEMSNNHAFQGSWFQYEDHVKNHDDHDHDHDHDHDGKCSSSSTSSIGEESNGSSSISSSDTRDDASSSASSSFSSNCGGALYDFSEIMEELPIKRGLSKFYKGKSESFTSLSRVTSIEDLAKKAISNRRNNLKLSKSIGTSLFSYKPYTLPKPIISKKTTRGSSFSSFTSKKGGFFSTKPPLTPLHKNLEC